MLRFYGEQTQKRTTRRPEVPFCVCSREKGRG
jgi:hypothetical protein